jgi:pilus assembly protein CpaF
MMMLLSGVSIPQRAMRQQIGSAVNIVINAARLSDGTRKVVKIAEISGMEGDTVMMQDLYEFKRTGVGPNGEVIGQFGPTGIRSVYSQRLEAAGYKLESKLFRHG